MYKELMEDNLATVVKDNKTVLVQYSAGWCGNCRMMKPKFKKMADEHQDIEFIMVDAEKYPESRKMATVDNLPTFAAFENGAFVKQVQTNRPEQLKQLIDEVTAN